MRVNFFALLIIISFVTFSHADTYREYKDVKKEIETEERNLQKVLSKKSNLIDKLSSIENGINKNRLIIKNINKDIAIIERNLTSINNEIELSERNIKNNKVYITLSNKFMVENVRYFPLLVLLTSTSLKESIMDLEILTIAINNMSDKISLLKGDIDNFNRLKEGELKEKATLVEFYELQKDELARVNRLNDEHVRVLTLVKNDELARRDYINQLKSKERELDKILKSQKATINDKSAFGKSRGKLELPINGRIIERFGKVYIKDADVNIYNKGIKIAVDEDSFAKVIYDGRVVFADNVKGLLYIVVVQHDGGYYSVYANINQLAVQSGGALKRGDSVGAIDDGSYLYFELRRGANAINPIGWFK